MKHKTQANILIRDKTTGEVRFITEGADNTKDIYIYGSMTFTTSTDPRRAKAFNKAYATNLVRALNEGDSPFSFACVIPSFPL